jgi:hypothetical protein
MLCLAPCTDTALAQQTRLATVTSLRCTFVLNATGSWKEANAPGAVIAPATLVLTFEDIKPDEGTAQQRTGSARTELVARLAGRYLHLMQSFRTGPLYTTTVFEADTAAGPFKAVHSRHEYFTVPLPGATSSPEQYYGTCGVPR